MEASDYISLGALIFSAFAVYFTWKADKRVKDKDETESKILLNISCEYDFYNSNVVKIGETNTLGQGLRFSLAIHNFGFRHAFIKDISLMESNQLTKKILHTFSLRNNTVRSLKSTDKAVIDLYLSTKELTRIIDSSEATKIFIRVYVEGDLFFDSNSTRIKV